MRPGEVHQEDRLPAEMLCQEPPHHRPQRVGGDGDRRQVALEAGALPRRNRFADQGLRQRHEPASAKSLKQPRHDQQFQIRGARAQSTEATENTTRAPSMSFRRPNRSPRRP